MTTKRSFSTLDDVSDELKQKGYIRLSTLTPGTKILVETVARVYECVIIENGQAFVQSSWPGLECKVKCKLVGCVNGDGTPFADLLLHEHHLIMKTPDGKHSTGRVLGVTLRGKNEDGKSWNYDLWS